MTSKSSYEPLYICIFSTLYQLSSHNAILIFYMIATILWRDTVSAGRRHTNGYELCPSSSRFIFMLIRVGVSSKAFKRFMRVEPLISHTGILMTFYLSIILDLQNFFHWYILQSWKLETTDTASSASFLYLYLEFNSVLKFMINGTSILKS